MASGKSSLGMRLAKALHLDFIDLDEAIETSEGIPITEIFSKKGELYFRKRESDVLNEILEGNSYVLATGGGTPCYGKNMQQILEKSTHSFYLKLSISDLTDRISKESETRPLVKNIPKEELHEFIGKHLFERNPFYAQAKHTIVCDDMAMDAIVQEIKDLF